MKLNNKKIIAIIIIFFSAIIAIKKCTNHFDEGLIKSLSEDLPNTKFLNEEYLTIIKEKYRSKALVNIVRNSKVRNPIAAIEFDKNYLLFIYKIDILKDTSLNSLLVISPNKEAKEQVRIKYKLTDAGLYDFINKSGPVPNVSNIYIGFNADSITKKTINDSLVTYGLVTNNLSIHYRENDTTDIIIKGKDEDFGKSVNMSIEILFLKRKSSVFFLTLTAKNLRDTIPPNLLYNIATNSVRSIP